MTTKLLTSMAALVCLCGCSKSHPAQFKMPPNCYLICDGAGDFSVQFGDSSHAAIISTNKKDVIEYAWETFPFGYPSHPPLPREPKTPAEKSWYSYQWRMCKQAEYVVKETAGTTSGYSKFYRTNDIIKLDTNLVAGFICETNDYYSNPLYLSNLTYLYWSDGNRFIFNINIYEWTLITNTFGSHLKQGNFVFYLNPTNL